MHIRFIVLQFFTIICVGCASTHPEVQQPPAVCPQMLDELTNAWLVDRPGVTAACEHDSLSGTPVSAYTYGIVTAWNANTDQVGLARAFTYFERAAAAGYTPAIFELGVAYRDGRGVQKDDTKAMKYFRECVAQGDTKCMHSLALLLNARAKTPDETKEVVSLWKRAAELGDMNSLYAVALLYLEGTKEKKDLARGLDFLERAANAGEPYSAYLMGAQYDFEHVSRLYGFPTNGSHDYEKARRWYQIGAERKENYSRINYSICLFDGKGGAVDKRKAYELLCDAAQEGILDAEEKLGLRLYKDAAEYPSLYLLAAHYLKRAATRGAPNASALLGIMFQRGQGVRLNRAAGVSNLHGADKAHVPYASLLLGFAYAKGWGVKEDHARAVTLFKRARDLGVPEAYSALAWAASSGWPGSGGKRKSLKYLKLGAEKNDSLSQYYLAERYDWGDGVRRDEKRANDLTLASARGGFIPAIFAAAVNFEEGVNGKVNVLESIKYLEQLRDAVDAKLRETHSLILDELRKDTKFYSDLPARCSIANFHRTDTHPQYADLND